MQLYYESVLAGLLEIALYYRVIHFSINFAKHKLPRFAFPRRRVRLTTQSVWLIFLTTAIGGSPASWEREREREREGEREREREKAVMKKVLQTPKSIS